MWNDSDTRKIVSSIDGVAKAINRSAKAQEQANTIAIEIEKNHRKEILPDDFGRLEKPPQGILGG